MSQIPSTQYAVQLVGPGELKLNTNKEVHKPGPHQVLAKVEAVGLCFSDLKLLKQFHDHPRKSEIIKGLDAAALKDIPSYCPGNMPTVPGHEVTCRIVAIGDQVTQHKVGERVVVQTDYRALPTAGSCAAFGYNFEGALQEYVLMDERVIIAPDGERFLIPVDEKLSASATALVEPWACVEDSYVTEERQSIKPGGRMLIVGNRPNLSFESLNIPGQKPASVTVRTPDNLADLPNEGFDDIIVFEPDIKTIELLNDKLAARAIMNLVLSGKKLGAPANIGVGRLHYGMTRWVGTTSDKPADSYRWIPADGEIRDEDRILVVGAGGPMGQMHTIRNLCSGKKGISVIATDMDDSRLESLRLKAEPMAKSSGAELSLVNTAKSPTTGTFTYVALMAPVPALVAQAVKDAAPGCIVNIFAGIPAPVKHAIDLDAVIEKRVFLFGTSGSTIRDMKIVLEKVQKGQLNTDCSVDAVSGMAGAKDGIAAVENRTLAGKIIVYPQLHDLPLTPLADLQTKFPTVAAKLDQGQWTKAAEQELLAVAK